MSSPGPRFSWNCREEQKKNSPRLPVLSLHEIYVFPSRSPALNLNEDNDKNLSNISDMGSWGMNISLSQDFVVSSSFQHVMIERSLKIENESLWNSSRFPEKSKFASHEKSQACVFYLHFCVSPLKRPNFVQLIFIIYYAAGAALFAARVNKKYENWIKCFWSGSWGWKQGSTWTAARQTMQY